MEVNLVLLIFCYLFILMTCIIYKIVFNWSEIEMFFYNKIYFKYTMNKKKFWTGFFIFLVLVGLFMYFKKSEPDSDFDDSFSLQDNFIKKFNSDDLGPSDFYLF
jgi:energy-coupling factor transporter transmembrane protein EcfT